MNKRIQELIRLSAVPAEQAEDYAESKGLIEPAEKLDVAKFAQLIIKECADVAADHDALDIYEEIREHFGVEE